MRRRLRRGPGRDRSRGQALVEFALVVPVFILLVAGMIDFGMGLYSYMSIINAARDGARLGATACTVAPCSGPVSARVTAAAGGIRPTTTVACTTPAAGTVNCATGTATRGDTITVTVAYTYHMIWPLAWGNQINMASSAVFMIE
jgi:Flp pilus assembly protein TadG